MITVPKHCPKKVLSKTAQIVCKDIARCRTIVVKINHGRNLPKKESGSKKTKKKSNLTKELKKDKIISNNKIIRRKVNMKI